MAMADVSYLQLHQNDALDDEFDNNWSHDLNCFDLYASDLDFPSTDDFLSHTDPNENDSILFDRENQVNFVIDMFHQRVEQSQSNSVSRLVNRDRSLNVGTDANDSDVNFGLGLGLGFPVDVNDNFNDEDDNLGFMLADCGDDLFISRRTRGNPDPFNRSQYFMNEFRVPDLGSISDVEHEIDFGLNGVCDHESNWDAFQLEDGDLNANEDFEWEEIDGRIDDREVLNMIFESEPDDDTSDLPRILHDSRELREEQPNSLEWEVLLNHHNLEENPDLASNQYDEHEMLFGQFVDNNALSSLSQPPASRKVVENLLSVVITDEDVEKNNTLCAVCKDEIVIGLIAKQLPCAHMYHADCIIPWLGIRNTCPVCRHELLTDDPDYERRKSEGSARHR